MFKGQISLITALEITIISMFIVFAILAILSSILSLFKLIPAENSGAVEKKINKAVQPQQVEKKRFNPEEIKSEEMRVAMMIASIEAAGDNKDANIKVVGIKELN